VHLAATSEYIGAHASRLRDLQDEYPHFLLFRVAWDVLAAFSADGTVDGDELCDIDLLRIRMIRKKEMSVCVCCSSYGSEDS
jgi:uncharacterized protein (DUF2249 family)